MHVPPGRQGPGPIAPAGLEALDLAVAQRASGAFPGERRASGVGAGTELAQLRPYEPGDDVRQLDPAATARTGTPHVRLQVPERLLTTWVLLDISPSMAFGTAERLKSDVAEGVVGVVGRLGVRRGGRVGLLTCGAPVTRLLPPRSGRGALVALRRVLEEGVAVDATTPAMTLRDGLRRLARLARRPGLVMLVSDFRGPVDWRTPMHALATRHSTVAVEVRDPREASLPAAGRLALVDPESGSHLRVDTSSAQLRQRYESLERAGRDAVAGTLRRTRTRHVVLGTDGPWLRDLGRGLR